jgi:hypothetical protein
VRGAVVAVSVVILVIVAAAVGYTVGIANQQTRTVTTTIFTTTQSFVTPSAAYFYVNGKSVIGTMCYGVPTGSSTWNVTANYPWKIQNATAYPPPVGVEYAFAPFPLNSSIPTWLHLSMQPPYVALAAGQNSTAILELTLDSTVHDTQTANFAVHAYYTDPVSGSSVVDVIVLELVVNGLCQPV